MPRQSTSALSSRAIIGAYFLALEQNPGADWIGQVSNLFTSDQESESYKWLGSAPVMREWINGRVAKGLAAQGITIENKHFEATLNVSCADVRRDKTAQIMLRVQELALRTNTHWAKLLSTLINAGESTVCYDGDYFFGTSHTEGASGTQSNIVSVDMSALPVSVHGSNTAPSTAEMQAVILQAIQAMYGFKDDQGEPMNEDARDFLVMVPTALFNTAVAAATAETLVGGVTNELVNMRNRLNIQVAANPRLTFTSKFPIFRTDGAIKSLIRQEETAVMLKAQAEGSPHEMMNDEWLFGVDTWRNVGAGYWQRAVLANMT